MGATIPDFGRGTTDPLGRAAAKYFKPKEEPAAKVASALDKVDLQGALDNEPAKKKWTVLCYIDGNNNLFGPAYETMKNLEKVGSNGDVNVVAELGANPGQGGGGGWMQQLASQAMAQDKIETVKRYLVTKDTSDSHAISSPELADLGKADMGDPKTVSDFLKWGIQNYPAEHYAVIMFNHGAGFAGILSDENTHSLLSSNDLGKVIDEAAAAAGQKIDVVDLDACLMAQAEVGHVLKNSAKFLVASEETERGMAQPLHQVIKDLQDGSQQAAMAPADLARLFVYNAFNQRDGAMQTCTLSAIDLEKMGPVAQAAAKLADVVKSGKIDAAHFRDDVKKSESFCQGEPYKIYNDYHDLGHLAQILQDDARIQDPEAKQAAAALGAAVKDAVIARENSGKTYTNSSGMSTYLPLNFGHDPKPRTDSVNFAHNLDYKTTAYGQDTGWSDMLTSISKDSVWHNGLKTVGMSKDSIDALDRKLHTATAVGKGAASLLLGASSLDGKYEAIHILRHGAPGAFLGLGASTAAAVGLVGGTYQAVKGASALVNAFRTEDAAPTGITDLLFDSRAKKINALLDIAGGAAVAAASGGLILGLSAALITTAGALALAIPVAKTLYDVSAAKKNLQHRAEEAQKPDPNASKPVTEKLADMTASGDHLTR